MDNPKRRERIKEVLEQICGDAEVEARWLNTLSLLEYIGARKIGKTVASSHPQDAEVLDHWADETRHAYAFKRLCEQVSPDCSEYLCEEESKRFFATLDERASEWMESVSGKDSEFEKYLLVTTLIERRAMMIYPLYRAATPHDFVAEELQSIVVEEQDHRVAIEENALELLAGYGIDDLEEPDGIEAELFDELLEAFDDEARRLKSV
jgi:hypothetical protein